jgi:hypothetical protein
MQDRLLDWTIRARPLPEHHHNWDIASGFAFNIMLSVFGGPWRHMARSVPLSMYRAAVITVTKACTTACRSVTPGNRWHDSSQTVKRLREDDVEFRHTSPRDHVLHRSYAHGGGVCRALNTKASSYRPLDQLGLATQAYEMLDTIWPEIYGHGLVGAHMNLTQSQVSHGRFQVVQSENGNFVR